VPKTSGSAPGRGSTFPVLTPEVAPRLALQDWTLRLDGLVEAATTWTWDEAHALPDPWSELRHDGD
jgi:DMSO/TMAO reductase YedYZ molybdopterin-dependent catalytic subunit